MTTRVLDVHLMISNPDDYLEAFAEAGADWITVHVESCGISIAPSPVSGSWERRPGAVLNPATSLSTLDYILEDLDLVMLMTVNPALAGKSFIPSSLEKTWTLHQRIRDMGLDVGIEVDGGISSETIADVAEAGANILVAGSAVYGSRTMPPQLTSSGAWQRQVRRGERIDPQGEAGPWEKPISSDQKAAAERLQVLAQQPFDLTRADALTGEGRLGAMSVGGDAEDALRHAAGVGRGIGCPPGSL